MPTEGRPIFCSGSEAGLPGEASKIKNRPEVGQLRTCGWVGGWVDGQVSGWMDGEINRLIEELDKKYNAKTLFEMDEIVSAIIKGKGNLAQIEDFLFMTI